MGEEAGQANSNLFWDSTWYSKCVHFWLPGHGHHLQYWEKMFACLFPPVQNCLRLNLTFNHPDSSILFPSFDMRKLKKKGWRHLNRSQTSSTWSRIFLMQAIIHVYLDRPTCYTYIIQIMEMVLFVALNSRLIFLQIMTAQTKNRHPSVILGVALIYPGVN